MKKVVAVTGGTGGIGAATCREFAKLGYAVMLCDVSQDSVDKLVKELKDNGYDADGMVCDISDKAQTKEFAARAAAIGRVQGVIQLGGLTPTFSEAKDIVRVDTLGPMNINESFYEVMESGSCIIDICSSTAHFVPLDRYPIQIFEKCLTNKDEFYDEMVKLSTSGPAENNMHSNMAYTFSRCFIYWYARHCAAEYGRSKGIRVMTVSPGLVRTKMAEADLEKSGKDSFDRTVSWTAMGRPATPEEVAFLFSTIIDERNSYLTGADIYFDGGADASGYHGQREFYSESK